MAKIKKKRGRKPKNPGGRGGGKRKTEEEEDAEMMQADMQGHRGTRLTVQPSCIVSGTMRWYQIEGLNWMINLIPIDFLVSFFLNGN